MTMHNLHSSSDMKMPIKIVGAHGTPISQLFSGAAEAAKSDGNVNYHGI